MRKKPCPNCECFLDAVKTFHWMARRYADGRSTYAVEDFNSKTRALLAMGVKLNPTGDRIVWARDGQGRAYDFLTEAEATEGTPEAMGKRP